MKNDKQLVTRTERFLEALDKLTIIETIGALYIMGATDENMTMDLDDSVQLALLAIDLFAQLTPEQQKNLIEILEVAVGTETTEGDDTEERR